MPFYVTFHGGGASKGIPDPQQYVVSYTPNGSGGWTVNENVFNLPSPSQKYNELRDIQLCGDGNFYVANAYKNASVIWQIPPSGAPSGGPTIFAQGAVLPCQGASSGPSPVVSIYHPFGFAFDSGMDTCYLSNQDDNIVVAVYGPSAASPNVPGEPLPVNPWLVANITQPPDFLPGTFVPSQTGFLPPCSPAGTAAPPSVSSAQGGLAYSPSSGPLSNSVRGVALLGTTLFVADEVGNAVRVYDTTSVAAPATIDDPSGLIQGPTHLLLQGNMLYIVVTGGSGSTVPAVLSYNTSQGLGTSNTSLAAVVFGVENPSGITFDNASPPNFYLASRTGQFVSQYDSSFKLVSANYIPGAGKVSTMPDQPEFILFVA
jgi:hypothetical protein